MTAPGSVGPNFGIIYSDDAYTTKTKLMGRQAAGKSLLKGMARRWPQGIFPLLCYQTQDAYGLAQELRTNGWTGKINGSILPDIQALPQSKVLYYPAPPPISLASLRSAINPAAFSLMGVTHTLSSENAQDQIASLILPPFQPWDALICTSRAAQIMVQDLHEEMQAYWREHVGATHFNKPQTPIIPLGVNTSDFHFSPQDRTAAREALGIGPEIVFLFAGRLSFHAKANPAPLYAALEKAAQYQKIICIEAGSHPSAATAEHFRQAQGQIAPNVVFMHVNGQDDAAYQQAWQAADVFTSLSDNIQETFGLTPVEAMAAGLPVLVSDWNGYKDTVRDGIDGVRVPTLQPLPGAGNLLSARHALGIDSYDYFIGRTSLATAVDPQRLADACIKLATDKELRKQMGVEGKRRAREIFDWSVILPQYQDLASELADLRTSASLQKPMSWPTRADPFWRFKHFATSPVLPTWRLSKQDKAEECFAERLDLLMLSYGFDDGLLPKSKLVEFYEKLGAEAPRIVDFAQLLNMDVGMALRIAMWLYKFGFIGLSPGEEA